MSDTRFYEVVRSVDPETKKVSYIGYRLYRAGESDRSITRSTRVFDNLAEATVWGMLWEDTVRPLEIFPVYYGYRKRGEDGFRYVVLTKYLSDSNPKELQHRDIHSPTGFAWGYKGSGPSDLAASIIASYFRLRGSDPNPVLYHDFKDEFIVNLPEEAPWRITGKQIAEWYERWRADNPDASPSVKRVKGWKRPPKRRVPQGFGADI